MVAVRKAVFFISESLCRHECDRCGQEYTFNKTYLAKPHLYSWWLCRDCKQRPSVHVKNGDDYCKPWVGDIDLDTLAPIKNNEPYMPGVRTCGKLDCVRSKHVIPAQVEMPNPTL